jgi:hypothetical protein
LGWLHWKNFSWQHWMFFFRLFTVCNARFSAFVIVLNGSPCERLGKLETGPILKEDISLVAVQLERLLTKIITLLGVSRATVSKVMSAAYTNHGKATSAKRNSGRKSTLTERYRRIFRRIISKNHRTTAAQVTGQRNWIFMLKTLFPQKLSNVSFTYPTSTVGLQLLNLWLLKIMLRCANDGLMTIKPGHQTTGNARIIWSYESSFTLFPTWGKVYVW